MLFTNSEIALRGRDIKLKMRRYDARSTGNRPALRETSFDAKARRTHRVIHSRSIRDHLTKDLAIQVHIESMVLGNAPCCWQRMRNMARDSLPFMNLKVFFKTETFRGHSHNPLQQFMNERFTLNIVSK